MEAAARDASAHDMISELPFGYDTLLDRQFKDGQDLSGGHGSGWWPHAASTATPGC